MNALIEDIGSNKITKAILKTFVDLITFDKESKSDFKIYMKVDQLIIDRQNEFMAIGANSRFTCCWLFVYV